MTPLGLLISRAASPGARMLLVALDAAGAGLLWEDGIVVEHEGRRVVVLVGDAAPPDGWEVVRVSERLCLERPQQAVVDVLAAVRERGHAQISAPGKLNTLAVAGSSAVVQSSEAPHPCKEAAPLPGRSAFMERTDVPGAAESSRTESPFQGCSSLVPWWELDGAVVEPLELQRVAAAVEAVNDLEAAAANPEAN